MSLGPTDIAMIFGQRGSGKSTLTRQLASAWQRRVVFDRLHEWNDLADLYHWPRARTFEEFAREISRLYREPAFTLIVQLDVEHGGQTQAEDGGPFDEMIRVLYKIGRLDPRPMALIIEEIHFYASPHYMPPWLFEAIMTGRHAGLAVVGNSQRPASVHKALISQAAHVFVGQLFEFRDVEYLAATIGDAALTARDLPKFRFLWFMLGRRETPIVETKPLA